MPLPKPFSTSLFTTGYKRLTEGGRKAFGWGRFFDGVWGWLAEGKLLKGELLTEKRIARKLLKGDC
jgi:hypothetical protein